MTSDRYTFTEEARFVEMQRRFSEADTFELELVQGLEQVIGQMSRLSTELQEEVMKARMTPRNSVGHGIEPPDKRLAAGKPEAGLFHCN